MFSALGDAVQGARVLDLYCGSGAYGLEALSRGAERATFVDTDTKAIEASRANAEQSGLAGRSELRKTPVDRYLARRTPGEESFDVIFADPPYATSDVSELLDAVVPVISADGWVVIESRWSTTPAPAPSGLTLQSDRRYGDTRVLMFRPMGAP